jgi:FAD synthase
MSYRIFIQKIFISCQFDHLVLGKDAHLGNQRRGTPQLVSELCTSLGACPHYLSKTTTSDKEISSSRIRNLLTNQHTDEAEELLGHPLETDESFHKFTHFSLLSN